MAAEYIDNTEIGSGIYPTKIPGYEDAADIQAALRLYHYGSTTIPTENTLGTASGINTKSIAGHFKAIDNTIQTLATTAYVTNAIAGVTDEYAQLAGTGIDWNAGANRFDLDYLSTVIEKTSNFTLEASNVGNTILLSTSSTIALTVPANSAIALPIGYKVDLIEVGSGRTTFTPGSGVTINSKNAQMYIDSQYGKATLLKIAENSWIAYGDIYEGASTPTPTPTPVAPTPVAPTPVAPVPVAPTPVAPTPVAPTPVAPVPVAPTPVAPTPVAPTPVAPTPVAPTPVAPAPVAPAFAITSTSSTTSSVTYSWANAPAGTVNYSIFYVYDDDTQSSVTTTSSSSATFSGLSSSTTYGVYVSARNSDGTTLASASASITTLSPTPTPVAPTPVAPTPVAPVPVAPTPVAPTPVAPTPVAPTPVAPTPVAPVPVAPTPVAPTPVAPTPTANCGPYPSGYAPGECICVGSMWTCF